MAKEPRDYLRWDLLDRSEDPVPWDTDDVIGLSRFYEKLSDAAKDAAADMRRLDGDELGEGDTVAALKELVKELPKHLDKAQDAYEKGYKALDRWQTSLGTARLDSASIARQAATAHDALKDSEAWKEKVDGDDPARDAFITRLTSVLNDMDEAARECADALEEAKQGSPRKLWGWLDKIVTWVEENPLLYAVAMVVAGLAAIFIPGLGIALALTVLAISAASLHKEGKLGFNRESLFTLGMDAISLVPGGALLRGGRAVGRAAGATATRMGGQRVAGGVRGAASSVRNGASRSVPVPLKRVARSTADGVSRAANTTGGKIATTIVKDSAASMASSVTVQVAGEGKSFSDLNMANEALTAFGTSAAGSTVGVLKDNGSLPGFGGGSDSGGSGGGGSEPAPDLSGVDGPDPDLAPASGGADGDGGGEGGRNPAGSQDGGPATGEGRPGDLSPDVGDGPPGATTISVNDGGASPAGGQDGGPAMGEGRSGDPAPSHGDGLPSAGGPDVSAASSATGGGDPSPQSGDGNSGSGASSAAAGDGGSAGQTPQFGDGPSAADASPATASEGGFGPSPQLGDGPSGPSASSAPVGDGGSGNLTSQFGDGPPGAAPSPTSMGDGGASPAGGQDSGPATGEGRSGDPAPSRGDGLPSAGGARDSATDTDGPGSRDSGESQGGRGPSSEPREDFAPVTRSGGGTNTPQPPASPRTRIGEPGDVDVSPGNRDGQTDAASQTGARADARSESRSDGGDPNPAHRAEQAPNTPERGTPGQISGESAPARNGEGTRASDAPRGDGSGASTQDGSTVTHTRTTGQGEFTTSRGPDGEQNTAYRYPATREGGSDFTMNVTRDGAEVNGTGVRSTERGFEVSAADGSSVRTQRDGTIRTGELEVTGPGGRGRASYRDGELTVSTSDGDVSVSRDPNGSEVRTEDGLTVRRDADGLRVSHTGDGPVDLRTNGSGPDVTRAAVDSTGRAPRAHATDPTTGRNAEVGVDGYRVDVPGASHGFDRADGTVRVESGGARAEVRPDSAHLSHADRGVDFELRQDGTGSVRGGPSSAEIRADGGIDLRSSTHGEGNDATLRQVTDGRGGTRPVFRSGNVTAEPGQVGFDHGSRVQIVDHQGTSAIHVVDGGRQRTYNMDGTPVLGETYPSLPLDPATNTPSLVIGSPDGRTLTSVTIEPGRGGDGPGAAPALRVDNPYGWSVRTSGDGDVSVAAPGGRENSLEVTRRGDGSVAVNTRDGSHRADNGGGRLSVSGPEGLRGDTDGDRVRVSDGEATTTARTDEGGAIPGERVAETRSDSEHRPPFGESSTHESSVSTSEGTSVWAGRDGIHTTMGPGREPGTVNSGDRTVDVTSDGLSARGTGRDSDAWEVSTSPDGTRGSNGAQSIDVTARPEGGGARSPLYRGNGGLRWQNPITSPDQIRFETGGDVAGGRSASGRTEVVDGANGTTFRDARGGVRVDASGAGPDLRVTEGHVRINAPDGTQHRVDIPTRPDTADPVRDGAGTDPARGDDGAPSPSRNDDGATPEGDRSADTPRGSRRSDSDPVTTLRDTRAAGVQAIPFEMFKNILNVVAGTGFDFLRHFGAEAVGQDWLSEGIAFGPDGLPNPSYVVQSFMQLGTAIPKAAAEGRYGGADGLPNLPLELGHQAMRNNLRDEYLDEYHEDFRAEEARALEEKEVQERIDALDALLDEKNLKKYEESRDTAPSDDETGAEVKERARVDRFLEDAKEERERLRGELKKLRNGDPEDEK